MADNGQAAGAPVPRGENQVDLPTRMKSYEDAFRFTLPRRLPWMLRLDGRAFATYTRGMEKPWDRLLATRMVELAQYLCRQIPGATLAYTQSDEISVWVHGYRKLTTEPWLLGDIQKLVSLTAGMAVGHAVTRLWGGTPLFHCKAFVLPEHEVQNYFVWRQNDAMRNSLQALAQSFYSQRQLQNVDLGGLYTMCLEKGVDWNALPISQQRGATIERRLDLTVADNGTGDVGYTTRLVENLEPPIFADDSEYVNAFFESPENGGVQ